MNTTVGHRLANRQRTRILSDIRDKPEQESTYTSDKDGLSEQAGSDYQTRRCPVSTPRPSTLRETTTDISLDASLSVSGIKQGSDSRRMSSSLRQSITARRVSHGGAVTTLFTEELAVERGLASQQIPVQPVSTDTSRRPSIALAASKPTPGRGRRTSRCLHEIQVQPRVPQRTLSQHQLLLLTPFGGSTPMMSPTVAANMSRKSGDLASGLFVVPAVPVMDSHPHTNQGQALLSPKVVSQPLSSSRMNRRLSSVDMSRASSMPTFTVRETQASNEKDDALGINRGGETYVWLDEDMVRYVNCTISGNASADRPTSIAILKAI